MTRTVMPSLRSLGMAALVPNIEETPSSFFSLKVKDKDLICSGVPRGESPRADDLWWVCDERVAPLQHASCSRWLVNYHPAIFAPQN